MMNWRETIKKVDFGLIALTFAIVAIGLIVLYSIGLGTGRVAGDFAKKQLVWAIVGVALMGGVALLDYSRLKNYIPFIFGVNMLLLLATFAVGKTALGAQRWVEFGGFRFQPSEFSKLILIITLAAYLSEKNGELDGWREVLIAGAMAAPIVVLILLQPDLGTALVLIAVMAGMFIVAGLKPKQLLILALVAYIAVFGVFKLNLLHEYQMKRLVVFVNPDVDPLGSGYNLRQSIIAIGSGGVLGKGLFSGTQSRLNFLPPAVRHTDFIFAVIGEELGLIGGGVLLGLIFLLLTRALRTAALARNHFGLLIASGIATMWIFQTLVNIGMTIGIMPVTGIPLPFVSYGGSSMMMNLAAVGLLLSIYSHRWD